MADHGDKGDKHQQESKHSSDPEDHGWQHREGYQYRMYSGDDRPPGWSQGKKTGWGELWTASWPSQEVRLLDLHLSGTPLLLLSGTRWKHGGQTPDHRSAWKHRHRPLAAMTD